MLKAKLLALSAIVIVCVSLFLTLNLRGDFQFAIELRMVRLAALIQVAIAIALSTVVFQTISNNRILTPSIMGMDALYILLQTILIFTLGALGFVTLSPILKFHGEVILMVLLVITLFLPLLRYSNLIQLLLLTGIVLGVLFRSLSSLIQRLIDPNDFAIVQVVSFANFNSVNETLLLPAFLVTFLVIIFFWRKRHVLDVLLLGRATAMSLGVNWRLNIVLMLVSVGILVSISTALVGPVTFLGLLVVAIADWLVKTRKHAIMFLTSCLISVLLLIGGQTILEHALDNAIVLGVLIEFVGGLVFLILLLKRGIA